MTVLLWIVAGLLLGLIDGVGGAVAGAALGAMIASLRKERIDALARHENRIAALERELAALSARLAHRDHGAAEVVTPLAAQHPPSANGLAPNLAPDLTAVYRTAGAGDAAALAAQADPAAPPAADALNSPPPQPALADPALAAARVPTFDLDAVYNRCRDALFGGNTLVRAGILVLFFGLAFLARYAVEHAMLPAELRLAGIALFGVALATLGWRLRARRRGYALTLQGGGIAVLYLSTFAALRLYGILPVSAAFALMLALVGVAVVLAIRQDAPALAIIGTAGGFAAPILASTGAGSHVQLFAYYAILNAGVLVLAWRKAWRGLNLTGFVFTFAIGLVWGARFYHPAHFATTEPFLVLFFLMYVAAAVAYAWKRAPALRDPVDGTLVFGVPVVGFGLQAALVYAMPYALAWSAAAVGAFYLVLATALHRVRKPELGLLVTSFSALGITFLTLALPLAFDGRWSAAAWALEGAALWWVGLRQQCRFAAAAGLLLQAGAGVLFAADLAQHPGLRAMPLANSALLGTVLIAGAGFFSAWCAPRQGDESPRLRTLAQVLLGWAWLWWLGGAWAEIDAHLTTGLQPVAELLLFALSGALATWLASRLYWPALYSAGLLALGGMAVAVAQTFAYGMPPSSHGGWLGWPIALWLHAVCLRALDRSVLDRALLTLGHAAGVWVVAFALSQELGHQAARQPLGNGWQLAAFALLPALLLALLAQRARSTAWPMAQWRAAYLLWAAAPVAGALALWSIGVQWAGNGDPRPLPYLALLNPLDLTVILALGAVAWWLQRAGDLIAPMPGALVRVHAALVAVAFIAFNGALLRAVHHATGLPWALTELLAADTTQTTLSLCWAVLGLGLMLLASRRASRLLWLAGAGLMGAVVIKLFVVDMAASGALARIVSFIGAGLVLLVVGYFSPLPPKRALAQPAASLD